jgi:hypothetical protein
MGKLEEQIKFKTFPSIMICSKMTGTVVVQTKEGESRQVHLVKYEQLEVAKRRNL